MNRGLLVKAISGFYYVEDAGQIRQCRARGVFKKKGIHPLVGDTVTYTPIGNQEGVIETVEPRFMELLRPPISNMDHAVLVFSVHEPEFSRHLLDRMLLEVERTRIATTIVLTKVDLASSLEFEETLKNYQEIGYPIILTSTVTGLGSEELRRQIMGRKTFVAGQSGVGKSSLLNLLMPEWDLKSAEISQKLGRGRHTTRHVELLKIAEETYIADTPGFSQLDFKSLSPEEVQDGFIEIRQFAKDCKYRGCLHETDEDCAVLLAVGQGISEKRYANYLHFLAEVQEEHGKRYD